VAKSIVIAGQSAGNDMRYHMLETLRQYAQEKLQDSGDSARLHRRHRDYFLVFAETSRSNLETRHWRIWARKAEAELENLRLALEWSFSDRAGFDSVEAGPRLILASRLFMPSIQEPLDWGNRAIALCQKGADISPRIYARLLGQSSHQVAINDPASALNRATQAVEISRGLGPSGKDILMWTLLDVGWIYMRDFGDVEAAAKAYAEAEALFHERGPGQLSPEPYLRAAPNFSAIKADLANRRGEFSEAKRHASDSIRLYEESGGHWEISDPPIVMGTACLNLGEYDQAREQYLEALHKAGELGGIGGATRQAHALRWLGITELRQSNLDRALEYCQQGLQLAKKISDNNILASCLALCAGIAAKRAQLQRAARLSGAAKALYTKQKRPSWEDSSLDTILPGWRAGPDAAPVSAAFEAGLAMTAEQVMAYALTDAAD